MSEASEKKYNLKIEGAGFSFSREIDERTLGRLMSLVLSGMPLSAEPLIGKAAEVGDDQAQPSRRMSLREFLVSKGAKRYPDKIVVIGKYLEAFEGKAEFSKEEVKSRFRSAGEVPPGNFARDFNSALTQGWLAEDSSSKGLFYITSTGDEALQEGFAGAAAAPKRRPTRKRRSGQGSFQAV